MTGFEASALFDPWLDRLVYKSNKLGPPRPLQGFWFRAIGWRGLLPFATEDANNSHLKRVIWPARHQNAIDTGAPV